MNVSIDDALRDANPVPRADIDGWSVSEEGHEAFTRVTNASELTLRRPRRAWRNGVAALAAVLTLLLIAVLLVAPWGSERDHELRGMAGRLAGGEWSTLDAGPAAGFIDPLTVWTGKELFVFAADLQEGAAFNPRTEEWRSIDRAPILAGSFTPPPVWTGKEILVFGSTPSDLPGRAPVRGAALDPATGMWRLLSPFVFQLASGTTATWTGREVVVVSGTSSPCPAAAQCVDVAGAYDVATDSWRRVPPVPIAYGKDARVSAVWDGSAVVMMIAQPEATFAIQWDLVGPRWDELPTPAPGGGNRLVSDGATVVDVAWSAKTAQLQAGVLDRAGGRWQQVAVVKHEPECVARGVAISQGALVFCSHEERLVLDLDSARWATLPRPPVPVEPGRWTGRQLLAMSHDGQALLRFMPAPGEERATASTKPVPLTTIRPASQAIGAKVTSFGTSVQVLGYEQPSVPGAIEVLATVDVEVCVAPPSSTEYGGSVAFRLEMTDGRRLSVGLQNARDPRFGTVRIPADGGCTRGFVAFAVPDGERPAYVVWTYDNFPETKWRVTG